MLLTFNISNGHPILDLIPDALRNLDRGRERPQTLVKIKATNLSVYLTLLLHVDINHPPQTR